MLWRAIVFCVGFLISMPLSIQAQSFQERKFDRPLYPIEKAREEGFLKVSSLHNIFYALYGNPNGIPIVILHGGPGCGCTDNNTQFFDLSLWNVIMFDQRGAMRSEPFGCMEENTPQHLIQDIEAIRTHLDIEKWFIFGGSWGSALAALYGEAHPENCLGFILRGVFLARKQDALHLLYDMGKIFPDAYESVVNFIPEEERHDLFSAYHARICHPDPSIHMPAARAFMRFDITCLNHLPNPSFVEKTMNNEKFVFSTAKAFFHYSKHEYFLQPNQILSQVHCISHLPAIIVQGRYDAICLPSMAYQLHQNWLQSTLWMIPDGGHSANDPSIAAALVAATDFFAGKGEEERK